MSSNHVRSVGQFLWNTTTGQWSWDAGMYELHGYRSGAISVTTDLVLEHKAEDHRDFARAMLQAAATADHSFSNYHQIVDADGRKRTVLTVGESRSEVSRPLPYRFSRGFMVDVTQDDNDRTRHAVEQARRSTATIQQTLGLLMGSFGLDEDGAFALLVRVSSHHNVKLRDLARRFMAAAVASAAEAPRDLSDVLLAQASELARERVVRRAQPIEP